MLSTAGSEKKALLASLMYLQIWIIHAELRYQQSSWRDSGKVAKYHIANERYEIFNSN